MWALRARGVPVSVVGPNVVYGYRVNELVQAFDELGLQFIPQPLNRRVTVTREGVRQNQPQFTRYPPAKAILFGGQAHQGFITYRLRLGEKVLLLTVFFLILSCSTMMSVSFVYSLPSSSMVILIKAAATSSEV